MRPKPWPSACRNSRRRRNGLRSCWSPGSPPSEPTFEKAVDEVRKENQENGQISAKTLSSIRAVIQRLKDKLATMPLEDPAENQEALNFVKTVTAMSRMLEKPDIDQVLAELAEDREDERWEPPGLHAHLQPAVRPGNHTAAEAGLHGAVPGPRPDSRPHHQRCEAR